MNAYNKFCIYINSCEIKFSGFKRNVPTRYFQNIHCSADIGVRRKNKLTNLHNIIMTRLLIIITYIILYLRIVLVKGQNKMLPKIFLIFILKKKTTLYRNIVYTCYIINILGTRSIWIVKKIKLLYVHSRSVRTLIIFPREI